MSDRRFPFESAGRRELDRTRRDNAIEEPTPVGYQDTEDRVLPLAGDSTAPYSHAIGRASSDGTTGSVTVADGDPQRVLVDELGRVWTRSAGGVTNVQGNVANDSPDAGTNPVKIGGRAVADCTGIAAVTVGDRVDAAFDVNGRQITLAIGNVPSDTPDACNPVKIGGYAADEAPNLVSAVADRVNAYFDRWGRQQVNFEKAIAGENQALHILRTMRGKVAVEQESWSNALIDNISSLVVKSAAGRLGRLQFLNTTAAGLYVLIVDNTSAAGANIKWRGFVPALAAGVPGICEIGFEESDGLYCEVGITVCVSTAVTPVTLPGVATGFYGNVLYV